ncbi:hypothetical protein IAU59_005462 [Kwoniella sp. CBS 9459]
MAPTIIEPAQFQRLLPVHDHILDFLFLIDPITCLLASKYHYKRYIPSTYRDLTFQDSVLWGLTRESPSSERTLEALSHVHTLRFLRDPHTLHNPHTLRRATRGDHPFETPFKELFPNVKVLFFGAEVILFEIRGSAILDPWVIHISIQNTLWFHIRRPLERVIIDLRGPIGEGIWKDRRAELERIVQRLDLAFFPDSEGRCEYMGINQADPVGTNGDGTPPEKTEN